MKNVATLNSSSRKIIDVSEQNELNYWCETLGIGPEVLKSAIRASRSNMLDHIIAHLKSSNKISVDYSF